MLGIITNRENYINSASIIRQFPDCKQISILTLDTLNKLSSIANWIQTYNIDKIVVCNNVIGQEISQYNIKDIKFITAPTPSLEPLHNEYVDILMLSYKRLSTLKPTLKQFKISTSHKYKLTIIDNGEDAEVLEFLKKIDFCQIIFNYNNLGLTLPTNLFWAYSDSKFLGKIDNDIRVPKNWLIDIMEYFNTESLCSLLGLLHWPPNLIKQHKMQHNIISLNTKQMIRQRYIGGNYIARKSVFEHYGFIPWNVGQEHLRGWTAYQCNISDNVYLGYLYPMKFWGHIMEVNSGFFEKYTREVRHMKGKEYRIFHNQKNVPALYHNYHWDQAHTNNIIDFS